MWAKITDKVWNNVPRLRVIVSAFPLRIETVTHN